MKGLLIFANNDLVKTHDLVKLEEIISKFVPEVKDIHQEASQLNRFYIETRYPGDFPEFSWTDAEKAHEAAKRIKEFVMGKVQ